MVITADAARGREPHSKDTHMTTSTTVTQAIARSVSYNEIVALEANWESGPNHVQDLRGDLLVACEDWTSRDTERGEVSEYWGTTDDGDEWRVHLLCPRIGDDDGETRADYDV